MQLNCKVDYLLNNTIVTVQEADTKQETRQHSGVCFKLHPVK
jgi:uncharacterized FlaG/YvyC family protein